MAMTQPQPPFSDQVGAIPGGAHLRQCYACGTCVSVCMVQQRLDSAFNPRRLLKKAMLDLTQDVFEDDTYWLCSACDLCKEACPQQIHISRVLSAIRQLAVADGRISPLRPAQVDALSCVACGLCVAVCPYEAISLQAVKVMGRMKTIARIDGNACMACGLCGALCRSNSIGLEEEFSNAVLLEDIRGWLEEDDDVEKG